jgi:hypothetical protein
MSDPNNITNCGCKVQQYDKIIFDNTAYQNGANNVYQNKQATVTASTNGTLGTSGNGQPIFKSHYERMQYLHGRQNQGINGASCGVPKKTFATRF